MEQEHLPTGRDGERHEQPLAPERRTPAQQALDANAAMEERLGVKSIPAGAAPATPELKPAGPVSRRDESHPPSGTGNNETRKKVPWGTICWVLFFATLFGSCIGMMRFSEQQQATKDQESLAKQEAEIKAQKQQAESTEKQLDAMAASASSATKERLTKMRECIASTPPSFRDDALRTRSQYWLHYCLTGKPPNFQIN